jgi:hypothetical protein
MSIFKINKEDFEVFTIHTNPKRHFSSSSNGVTGSVYVFHGSSKVEKENQNTFFESSFNETDVSSVLNAAQQTGRFSKDSKNDKLYLLVDEYVKKVNLQQGSLRNKKYLNIQRFTPTTTFSKNTLKKLSIKDNLSQHYRNLYQSAHWGFTNFNSLNFQDCSLFSTSSVLLYPNVESSYISETNVSGTYIPSGAFSFDFYINPRYRNSSESDHFRAATIFHMSSTYAVSLITGSEKDENGLPVGFRLLLQLSNSADVPPTLALPGPYPNNYTFLSDDNSLRFNTWSHVVIRWGTSLVNEGSGTFVVDKSHKGHFVIPASTIAPDVSLNNPDVLCVGNYYEGNNAGTNSLSYFFSSDVSTREGLRQLNSSAGVDEPVSFSFTHKLNAEVQNLAIRRRYINDLEIEKSSSFGPREIDKSDFAFFLPTFFIGASPYRQFLNDRGGIPQTPFFEIDGTTTSPFNVAMSFGINGHYINVENYVRDFANDLYPRLLNLTCSILQNTTSPIETNEFLYSQKSVSERNSLILPSDNGSLTPNYALLDREDFSNLAHDDMRVEDLSFVNLNQLVVNSSNLFSNDTDGDDSIMMAEQTGYTPESPGKVPGPAISSYKKKYVSGSLDNEQLTSPFTIYRRTNDASSNAITFFDISNLFYGMKIKPGSFVISDSSVSGSNVSITLKDNGNGSLYRENSTNTGPVWSSVGTIFYDEGLIAIKNPHINFFGKNSFEMSFEGEQNVHVQKIDILAQSNQLNSSSNPNFNILSASTSPTDIDPEFVYISSINFHDDNMNVVMKTNLAQPIMKRHGERIMFRIKHDW